MEFPEQPTHQYPSNRSELLMLVLKETVRCLAYSPDGALLASGSDDQTVRLWDVGKTKSAHQFKHDWTAYTLAFSPDGTRHLSGGADGTVRLRDVATGSEPAANRCHQSWVTGVAFAPDGMTAAASSADGTIVVWDME
jgi:WD40 repeat protein